MAENLPDVPNRPPRATTIVALTNAANREHRAAISSATNAVEHAVKAGEALLKCRSICDYPSWQEFIESNFEGSLRTAQKYMRLAKNIRLLEKKGPLAALSSQNTAAKALTEIIRGDSPSEAGSGLKRKRRARGASRQGGGGPSRAEVAVFLRRAIDIYEMTEVELRDSAPQPMPRIIANAIIALQRGASAIRAHLASEGLLDGACPGGPAPAPTVRAATDGAAEPGPFSSTA